MREPEGIETPLPGKSSERSWSKDREPDIRIVEVGGSSPLTSTTTQGQVRGLVHDVSSASRENGLGRAHRPGLVGMVHRL